MSFGTGLFTRHLLSQPVGQLILNDISPGMMSQLQENMTLPKDTKLIIGNAEKVEFLSTDLIAANAVFQWFGDPEISLNHLVKYLNPGGSLIFSTFGPGTLKDFRETACMESPATLFSTKQWEAMIQQAGLTLNESYTEFRKSFFPSTRAFHAGCFPEH